MMSLTCLDKDHVGTPSQPVADNAAIGRAILQTLAYADVFDYPLTAQEIHQYLIETATTQKAVRAVLNNGRLVPHCLSRVRDYFTLHGRESIVETRLRRAEMAARMWPKARQYGLAIASIPFVRMVAVTGALTMDNVETGDDFDYLIVTGPGRLWLCRAMIIALVVKPAARRGDEICPNYLLSERALVLRERNLFTAHELVQMVPLAGFAVYRRLRELNSWVDDFLPNAGHPPQPARAVGTARRFARLMAEAMLRTPVGAGLERWEMARKVRKLSPQTVDHSETAFSADWCKGHLDSHRHDILLRYAERLDQIEV